MLIIPSLRKKKTVLAQVSCIFPVSSPKLFSELVVNVLVHDFIGDNLLHSVIFIIDHVIIL